MASQSENIRSNPFHVAGFLVEPEANSITGPDGAASHVEPKVMDVLVMLATHCGEVVSRTALIESIWNVEFGGDESLTRAISVLRKTLGTGVIETIPKRGYRLKEGAVRPAQPANALENRARSNWLMKPFSRIFERPMVTIVATLLAVVVSLFVFITFKAPSNAGPQNKPLAHRILIENAPECEKDHSSNLACSFAQTLTQAMMNTRLNAIITTTPVIEDDLQSGRPLRFDLKTTQRQTNNETVVTLKVTNTQSGAIIWSKSMSHTVNNADTKLRQDAYTIANGLNCVFRREITSEIRNNDRALALFFDTCISSQYLDQDQMRKSARLLVEAAPQSSMAHGLLALAIAATINPNTSGRTHSRDHNSQQRALVRISADRALALDPNNSEANLAIALSYMPGGHWATRARHFQAAIENDPENAFALALYAQFLREVGRLEEAAMMYRSSATANPELHFVQTSIALLASINGRHREAEVILDRLEKAATDEAIFGRFQIAHWYGDPDDGIALVDRISGGYGLPFEAGQIDCARKFLTARKTTLSTDIDLATKACRDDNTMFNPSRYAAALGRTDLVFTISEEILASADSVGGFIDTIFLFYPEMRAVRNDPRFMPVAAKFGLVDHWIESGELPDFCDDADLPYDCLQEMSSVISHQQL